VKGSSLLVYCRVAVQVRGAQIIYIYRYDIIDEHSKDINPNACPMPIARHRPSANDNRRSCNKTNVHTIPVVNTTVRNITMSLLVKASIKSDGSLASMDGFPVRVYRKTELYGWQAMQPKNSQGRRVKVRASPKHGCVVLHRIQVRVRLTSSPPPTNDTLKDEKDTSERKLAIEVPAMNDVLVVRRRQCILISSKLRSRSLVFKFNDLNSCLKFSDQLIQLNPNQTIQTIPNLDQNYVTAWDGTTMKEHNRYEMSREKDTQQVLSYVGRLLCDDRFTKFCNNLESNLLSSEDGLDMFNSLIGKNKCFSSNEKRTSYAIPALKEQADTLGRTM
jgi:hypothetical protein